MAEREERDWSNVVSGQIAVYKTDKALLELMDNFQRHIYFRLVSTRPKMCQKFGKGP